MYTPNAVMQNSSGEPFPGAIIASIIVSIIIEYWWIFLPLAVLAYINFPKK